MLNASCRKLGCCEGYESGFACGESSPGTNVMGTERLKSLDGGGELSSVLRINGFWLYAADGELAGKIDKNS